MFSKQALESIFIDESKHEQALAAILAFINNTEPEDEFTKYFKGILTNSDGKRRSQTSSARIRKTPTTHTLPTPSNNAPYVPTYIPPPKRKINLTSLCDVIEEFTIEEQDFYDEIISSSFGGGYTPLHERKVKDNMFRGYVLGLHDKSKIRADIVKLSAMNQKDDYYTSIGNTHFFAELV
jgi:hypothetical protein